MGFSYKRGNLLIKRADAEITKLEKVKDEKLIRVIEMVLNLAICLKWLSYIGKVQITNMTIFILFSDFVTYVYSYHFYLYIDLRNTFPFL